MKRILTLFLMARCWAQEPDPFEKQRIAAQEKEKEWFAADEELRKTLTTVGPCAASILSLTMDAKRKSDAALEGLIAYYREWRTRNETILKYRQSSEKSAASEMQNIKSAADRTRAELESLKRRAADLSGLGADAGRSATLRDLIESVEANLRNWEDILLESKAESPGRQKAIAGAETLVKSISESILLTQDQRKLYAERYSARLDGFKLYCRNK